MGGVIVVVGGTHRETSVRMENVKFECKLETVERGEVVISLFKGSKEQLLQDGANDEFLMHLGWNLLLCHSSRRGKSHRGEIGGFSSVNLKCRRPKPQH